MSFMNAASLLLKTAMKEIKDSIESGMNIIDVRIVEVF